MNNLPRLNFVFRTVFIPTGAYFYGLHRSTDLSFGTDQSSDAYIGNGKKLIAITKANGNNRRLFRVSTLLVGTEEQCAAKLTAILSTLDYKNPLVLNSKEGFPEGGTHTAAARAAIATANLGNDHAIGSAGPLFQELQQSPGGKLKWFNNGERQQMIVVIDNVPVKEEFKDWKLGKLKIDSTKNIKDS
jgi:hypothetical protein